MTLDKHGSTSLLIHFIPSDSVLKSEVYCQKMSVKANSFLTLS